MMGNIIHRMVLCGILLNLSFSSTIIKGYSVQLGNKIHHDNNYIAEDDFEYSYTNVLDTDKDAGLFSDWSIREGENQWFRYFNNIDEVPEDVEFGGPYIVGFPKHFTKEEFLTNGDAEGIWMMVHADLPPDYDDPIAHIDFACRNVALEYDTVNITCYLNGNSSLKLIISYGGNSNETHIFKNSDSAKESWDVFFIESKNQFKQLIVEMYTGDNSSFVMVEKIVVGKKFVPTTTTPIYCTTPQTTTVISTENVETTEVVSSSITDVSESATTPTTESAGTTAEDEDTSGSTIRISSSVETTTLIATTTTDTSTNDSSAITEDGTSTISATSVAETVSTEVVVSTEGSSSTTEECVDLTTWETTEAPITSSEAEETTQSNLTTADEETTESSLTTEEEERTESTSTQITEESSGPTVSPEFSTELPTTPNNTNRLFSEFMTVVWLTVGTVFFNVIAV